MEKVVSANSWDFGEKIAAVVKASSRGIVGSDYSVLVKRAGDEFANAIRNVKMASGEIPVHVIAMGATEKYGPNRNGDGFKEATLRKYHDTFTKFAKAYRHHANKDPKTSYGVVKASAFNETMGRVELLLGLNATKEAAERNEGLVADKELEKLSRDEDLGVSMACKVAYDVCSGCGNKAKSRAEYCTADDCRYGGCRDNLTKVSEDGHVLHVDNPDPTFFDISSVIRPADRIAYGNRADYLQKAASHGVISGAEWAEIYGVTPPLQLTLDNTPPGNTANLVKLAYRLAALEDEIEQTRPNWAQDLARAFSLQTQPIDFGQVGNFKVAEVMDALWNSQEILLSPRDFVSLVIGGDSEKTAALSASVSGLLPGIYNRLISSGDLAGQIRLFGKAASRDLAPVTLRRFAEKHASAHSVKSDSLMSRTWVSAINSMSAPNLLQRQAEKRSAAVGSAEELARRYALYKLSCLSKYVNDVSLPLTCKAAIVQNYINC